MASTKRLIVSLLAAVAMTAATASPALAYPGPGYVTGDITVHDPTMIKRPGGGYLRNGVPMMSGRHRGPVLARQRPRPWWARPVQ